MPVTLAEAAKNAQTDLDVSVIDEFRKSTLMDLLTFDNAVNPAGGGATLTYGYRRMVTQATASARKANQEFTKQNVTTTHVTVGLGVFGGSFEVDRVLAKVGPAASGAVSLNMQKKIEATRAQFSDEFINGDKTANGFEAGVEGFDGLAKAVTDTATDVRATPFDWSAVSDQSKSFDVLDSLDEFLAMLDGAADAIVTNKKVLARIRGIARRAGYFTRTEGAAGTTIERYNGVAMIDAGQKPGTATDVVPVTAGSAEIYAVRFGIDGVHGVSTVGGQLVAQFLPDFTTAGAVKTGEVELGPAAVAVKSTKALAAGVVKLAAA